MFRLIVTEAADVTTARLVGRLRDDGVALLADTPRPSESQIRQALSGNLCRCGTHVEIVNAVHRAADLLALESSGAKTP